MQPATFYAPWQILGEEGVVVAVCALQLLPDISLRTLG